MKTTETSYNFTAKETNFLSSMPITTTVSGKPTTTTSTEYVSFVTATPMVNGKTEGAVVAAVVIAPALVASVQKVADGASGKTVDQLVSDLTTAFNGQKVTLTQGELTTLATYLLNLVAFAATAEVAAVQIGPYLVSVSQKLICCSSLRQASQSLSERHRATSHQLLRSANSSFPLNGRELPHH